MNARLSGSPVHCPSLPPPFYEGAGTDWSQLDRALCTWTAACLPACVSTKRQLARRDERRHIHQQHICIAAASSQLAQSPAMSVNDAKLKFETSEEVKVAPTFDAMGLKEDLLRGVYAYSQSPAPARG